MANKRKAPSAQKIGKKRRKHETIEGLPIADFIAQNADPIWLLQNGHYELLVEQYANAATEPDGIDDDSAIPY